MVHLHTKLGMPKFIHSKDTEGIPKTKSTLGHTLKFFRQLVSDWLSIRRVADIMH